MVSTTFEPLHPVVFPFVAYKAPSGPSIDSQKWVSEPRQGQPNIFVGSGGYQYSETVAGTVGQDTLSANPGNPIPGAYQIVSYDGPIFDASITLHWTNYDTGAHGTIPLYIDSGSTSALDIFYAPTGPGLVALYVTGTFYVPSIGPCRTNTPALSFYNP